MSTRSCKPTSNEDALQALMARWVLENEDHVDYDEDVIVIRLPRTGVTFHGDRRLGACWLDAGCGVLEATTYQVAEALHRELLHRRAVA